jgi:hypothetical protein
MHEQRAERGGFAGEDAGGQRVEGAGEVGFALGLVDGGVGGGVDDEVGATARTVAARLSGSAKLPERPGRRRGRGRRCHRGGEAALELPADLAVLAEEEDLHGVGGMGIGWVVGAGGAWVRWRGAGGSVGL